MPDSASASVPEPDVVDSVIAQWHSRPGPLLPILHGIQAGIGYIPESAIARIAGALNISRAEVHGVISFYHDFRTAPPKKHVVRVCRAEACQSMGAVQLEAHVKSRLARSRDVEMEPVYCLGNCACAPAMMINDHVYGRMTAETFDVLMAEHKASAKGRRKKA